MDALRYAEEWHTPDSVQWQIVNQNAVSGPRLKDPGVILVGQTDTWQDCQSLCDANVSCDIFDWAGPEKKCAFNRNCYFREDGIWKPTANGQCNHTAGKKLGPTPPPTPGAPTPPTPAKPTPPPTTRKPWGAQERSRKRTKISHDTRKPWGAREGSVAPLQERHQFTSSKSFKSCLKIGIRREINGGDSIELHPKIPISPGAPAGDSLDHT